MDNYFGLFCLELVRNFFLISGSIDGDFYVNELNTDYVDAIIDEHCKITVA